MDILDIWRASETRAETERIAREHGIGAYVVGGAIRDMLLGRDPHDWDLVTEDSMRLARAVADGLDGAFVWLHDNPVTVRVVVGAHDLSVVREELDFSDARGGSVSADLCTRDFTVNSIAWPVGESTDAVIDPRSGRDDLHARLIRANGLAALAEDPVRCLRAHRLAAQLGFDVEPRTRGWIAECAAGLANVPAERVGSEFTRLAQFPGFADHIQLMHDSGLLAHIMPELSALQGVTQGGYHHLDAWGHTLLVVEGIEAIARRPADAFPGSAPIVAEYLGDPQRLARLKMAALTHDIGKPENRAVIDDRIRFIGHEKTGTQTARAVATRLRFTRNDRHTMQRLTAEHMRPMLLVDQVGEEGPSLSAIRRLFRDTDPDGVGLLILASADLAACQGHATSPAEQAAKAAILDGIIVRYDAWRREEAFEPLLRGYDLIDDLGLEPGPAFSAILGEVERAQTDGEITTREQALDLARSLVAEGLLQGREEG